MSFATVPFLLLVIPLTEIAAFVLIGEQIGVWATLGFVLFTAVVGSFLLRWQGFNLVNRIRTELAAERLPAQDLVRGLMLLIAGILLLTPGFVTDAMGFLLFVPPIQLLLWQVLKSRITISNIGADHTSGFSTSHNDSTIDLDPDDFSNRDETTPWRKPHSQDKDRRDR